MNCIIDRKQSYDNILFNGPISNCLYFEKEECMKFFVNSLMSLFVLLVSACGSGGDGDVAGSCDEPLTVGYHQNEIAAFPGFSESNTSIVHTDGNQGNTYDVDIVAVSRITHNMNESLAFSYSIYGTTEPPTGTYSVLYLDTDKSVGTGMVINTVGADALVVNAAGGSANGFYLWNGSSWIKQSVLGSLASNATYFQGCTYSTSVYAPLFNGLSSLYSTAVTGIVMVVTIPASDPTTITSIIDTSTQFDFTVP